MKGVYSIPRQALRENKFIWIAKNSKLDIRSADILWRSTQQVILREGIADGEMLIVSDMTAPIQGMDVNA